MSTDKKMRDELNKIIGRRVRELRQLKSWSIEELAHHSGINDKYLGRVELGKATISVFTLYRIGRGLKLEDPHSILEEAKKEIYPTIPRYEEK